MTLTPLTYIMDFDLVVRVDPDGMITEARDVQAPSLFDDDLDSTVWTLLDGFSGQHGYSGPLMHQSEYVGGGLESYIRSHPGLYVSLVNTPADDTEPTEWAVAYCPLPDMHHTDCDVYQAALAGEPFGAYGCSAGCLADVADGDVDWSDYHRVTQEGVLS